MPKLIRKLFMNKIGKRIVFVFYTELLVLVGMLVIFCFQSKGFIKQYQEVLDNLVRINFIKTEVTAQPKRLIELAISKAGIAESKEEEKLALIQGYIESIGENIGDAPEYKANQTQLGSISRLMNKYIGNFNQIKTVCQETYGSAGYEFMYQMEDGAGFISDYCTNLMELEMDRSNILQQEITKQFDRSINGIIILVAGIAVCSILLCTVLTGSITKPVRVLKEKIEIMAGGDLSGEEIRIRSEDELKALALAFNNMKSGFRQIIQKAYSVTGEIHNSIQVVNASVKENTQSSISIADDVNQMTGKMENQSHESRDALEQVQIMSDISDKIMQSAGNILKSADCSLEHANTGNENIEIYVTQLAEVNSVMKEVSGVTEKLNDSTKEMNTILNSISEIADQTNLLSLNASIEAARAGEAGKGFAVVAAEIRKLAEDSRKAAGKIGDIVAEVQQDAADMTDKMQEGLDQLREGNRLADTTKSSFQDIKESTIIVNRDIKHILEQLKELAGMIEQVTDYVKNIDCVTGENAGVASQINETVLEQTEKLKEVSNAMAALTDLAEGLGRVVSEFKI